MFNYLRLISVDEDIPSTLFLEFNNISFDGVESRVKCELSGAHLVIPCFFNFDNLEKCYRELLHVHEKQEGTARLFNADETTLIMFEYYEKAKGRLRVSMKYSYFGYSTSELDGLFSGMTIDQSYIPGILQKICYLLSLNKGARS
jgi:hypothetical protein